MFPSQQFDFPGFPDRYGSSKNIAIEDREISRCNHQEQDYKDKAYEDFGCSNDSFFDVISSLPFQSSGEIFSENQDLVESRKEERSYGESLKILQNYQSRFRRLNAPKRKFPIFEKIDTNLSCRKLSVAEIIKLAAEKIIQGSSQDGSESSILSHPFASSFLGYSQEDYKDVELVTYLLASAEKVGENQFERARKFVDQCDKQSSAKGNAIERVVYYFSGAIHERIDRETGNVTPRGLGNKQSLDIVESLMDLKPDIIAMQKYVPFGQVWQFAAVQSVLDHVTDAKNIHIIDLEIRTGMQYTILMQALAARTTTLNRVEYLKVTAVCTKSREKIEETGKQLVSFAKSLNLDFAFNIVMVEDILELNVSRLDINADEAVAVYAELILLFLISRQDRLESLMNVIKNINPRIMVIIEVEANHNSPAFVNRFIETLCYFGAFFDCLEDCLKHDEASRMFTEGKYFSQAIRTIVAAEGEERTIRHVTMNVWRMFLSRFGIIQVELSSASVYQANLMLNNFDCGSSCTIEMDGKSLIVGWKGTPIHSLSAWKVKTR